MIGIVFNYCLLQGLTWTVLHAVFLFWGVNFPFSYRQLQISGKMRHAHIISVLLALTIPLPSGLLPLKDGHLSIYNPTFVCNGRNTTVTYYTFILPLSIIIGVAACLQALTIWTIFKVKYGLVFSMMCNRGQ